MARRDPIAAALRAYLLDDNDEDDDTVPIVETSSTANAVVRTVRIPWCDGHLEWKVRCPVP
jgi:hypothetical protein